MGNRAVITTRKGWEFCGVGIYLHWNGGRDSVEAFLEYCKLKGYRPPDEDNYGWARLCQVIGNFFGGTGSIGIDTLWHLDCDNYDNGVYIIEGWEIVDRCYMRGGEQTEYDLTEMLASIDACQPEKEQIGEAFFTAETVATDRLKVGDKVYVPIWTGEYQEHEIVGIGDGRTVNGLNTEGVPYVDTYGEDFAENVNNYLQGERYKVVRDEQTS